MINLAKGEFGRVEMLHCHQWVNTSNVIDCFENIVYKRNYIFIEFDIEDFYPLITKHIILKAIEQDKTYTSFT